MATTSKKVSALPAITTATGDDLLYIVNDPAGNPESYRITVKQVLESNVIANAQFGGILTANAVSSRYVSTPANSSSVPVGFAIGTIWSDGSYIYVVTGASALKRAAIATW